MKKLTAYTIYVLIIVVLGMCKSKDKQLHSAESVHYACPMHPEIIRDAPGTCPVCKMDLVKLDESVTKQHAVMLSESQVLLGGIKIMVARSGSFGTETVVTGKLIADAEKSDVVSARVAGRIERLYFKEAGQSTVKGQPLYEIYSETLQTLQREFIASMADAVINAAARNKLQLLGMTTRQIDDLKLNRTIAPRIVIASPVSGVIAEVNVSEGQYVPEGGAVYKLQQLDPIWVEAALFYGEEKLLKAGDAIQVLVGGDLNKRLTGKVIYFSKEHRAGSQVLILRASLPNPGHTLLSGMQANILLPQKSGSMKTMASNAVSISIPSSAVLHDTGSSHLWIQADDGSYEKRIVEIGLSDFEKTEVVKGILPGDHIVVEGGRLLDAELELHGS